MTSVTTNPEATQPSTETSSHLFDDWFDPIEAGIRDRVREFIEEMIRGELDAVLSRGTMALLPTAGSLTHINLPLRGYFHS